MTIRVMLTSFLFILSGCMATTSSVVVGEKRAPTNWENIKVYLEPPDSYELIALIESTSELEWAITEQGKTDAVIENLKIEAAKHGANGILLYVIDDKISIGSSSDGKGNTSVYSSTDKIIKGKAIFVKK